MPDRDRADVSVIVPTFNRAARLDTLLDDLSHQDTDGRTFEVFIVDNGSSDDTLESSMHGTLGIRESTICWSIVRAHRARGTRVLQSLVRRYSRSSTTMSVRRQTGSHRYAVRSSGIPIWIASADASRRVGRRRRPLGSHPRTGGRWRCKPPAARRLSSTVSTRRPVS